MSWLWAIPVVVIVAVGAIALTVYVFNRDLTSGGPRPTAGAGNPFGALSEVFDPGAHRAQMERERLKHQVTVTPSPGPDIDRRARVVTDRYGNPTGFRPGVPGTTGSQRPDTPASLPPPA